MIKRIRRVSRIPRKAHPELLGKARVALTPSSLSLAIFLPLSILVVSFDI
jgi:hypothetical protein